MLLRDFAAAERGPCRAGVETRQVGANERTVHLIDDARPVDALLVNLIEAVRLLESSGADYWMVRPTSGIRFVFGARLSQREAILAALRRTILEDATLQVRRVLPRPHVKTPLIDGNTPNLERQLAASTVLRLARIIGSPDARRIFGEEYSAEIEFWDDLPSEDSSHQFDDELIAPRVGATTKRMRVSEGHATLPLSRATALAPRALDDVTVQVPASQAVALPGDITFPIDAVYTWVDGEDPEWRRIKDQHSPSAVGHDEVNTASRFASRDELRFSLRSLRDFAPWIRNVYIVTAGQRPAWLTRDDRITVVDHKEIFNEPSVLPTFNSHAIESQLHHIEGLAEHFIYLNDDMFFGRAVTPGHFFFGNGAAKHKLSPSRVPQFAKDDLDTPVDLAVKNSRAVMEAMFGVRQAQVLEHSPYPLHRSVLQGIEDSWPEQVAATASHRFRHAEDLNIPSHLAHHVAYSMCKSFPSNSVSFSYIGLHRPDLAKLLARRLARQDSDTFCINDTYDPVDPHAAGPGLREFFEEYFPVPAEWETER